MKKIYLPIFFMFVLSVGYSQTKKYQIRTIAFYNLENLFDTINDPNKNDEASPMMELKGNKSKVYWDKIGKLASVIAQLGKQKTNTSPAIIGVAEVENRAVLKDLIKTKYLKEKGYGIIHYESPDKRGIDVALLYQTRYFEPVHHQKFQLKIYRNNRRIYTRDQLLVSGYLDDEMIHIIVNHWPSRRGGEKRSRPLRKKAAYLVTQIIAKVRKNDPKAKIIIMGDFNDDPINASFKEVLKTKSRKKNVKEKDIYNPYEDLFRRGFNTLVYRDNINLFDQIMITYPFLSRGKKDFDTYKMYKAMIFNKRFLTAKKKRFKGYPLRSFSNGKYTGGYSDHYPVYMYLIRHSLKTSQIVNNNVNNE